ncbi:hypothetical protein D3C86_1734670 [compost metagenome]
MGQMASVYFARSCTRWPVIRSSMLCCQAITPYTSMLTSLPARCISSWAFLRKPVMTVCLGVLAGSKP